MNAQSPQGTNARDFDFGRAVLDALAHRPDACAFRCDQLALTRGDLREKATKLADRLRAAGLRPGTAVAIEIEHSLDLPIALCGALAAGACVVPIDPFISAERRLAIREDIDPDFRLTRDATAATPIRIEKNARTQATRQALAPDLAFVVYTSGSSGGPKGVMISQESYQRRMQKIAEAYVPSDDDIDLAWTPSSFTVMVDEIFLPIILGVPSVIASPALRADPHAFADLVRTEQITCFRVTPSVLDLLLRPATAEALGGVRTVICSGEAMPADLQRRVHELLPATLLGFYGATEAPAVASIPYDRSVPPNDDTICTPQPFSPMRIVTKDGTEAETSQIGEVWVGGLALARGYYRRPELTAEKFLERDGARWYRTGDLGRQLANGQIQILGRADTREININGTRVNLPEVSEAIRARPGIAAAFVSPVQRDEQRDPILVALCVIEEGASLDATSLRKDLASRLPSPAIPPLFFPINEMPLTDNGKIDARGLHKLAIRRYASLQNNREASSATPSCPRRPPPAQTGTPQALLADILDVAQTILATKGLTGTDSFFASGGDSLMAVHLALALGERLEMPIKTTLVANADTFEDMAQAIASGTAHASFAAKLVRDGSPDAPPIFTFNDRRRYELLAPQLSTKSQIWNLNIFGLPNTSDGFLEKITLHHLAETFADQVLATHPSGPWRLLAFCQSACVAVETARVLNARTDQVAHLYLVDAFFQDFFPTPRVRLMRLLDLGPLFYGRKLLHKFGMASGQPQPLDVPNENDKAVLEQSKDDAALRKVFDDVCWSYRVTPYDGPVTAFISKELRHNDRKSCTLLAGQGLKVHEVEGLHLTLFQPRQGNNGLAMALDAELCAQDRETANGSSVR